MRPIGVFDSGVGGLSVLSALREEMPEEDFLYFSDAGHAPYGEHPVSYLVARSRAVTEHLVRSHRVRALVVACNTATGAALDVIRAEFPTLPIIGLEPALKPAAAMTRTGRVAVLATRRTLTSDRVLALESSLRGKAQFALQPCDGLASAIERWEQSEVRSLCSRYLKMVGHFGAEAGQFDTIVLGCTHYVLVRSEFERLLGPAVSIVDSGKAVAQQTRRVLDLRSPKRPSAFGRVEFVTTGCRRALEEATLRWHPRNGNAPHAADALRLDQ